MKYINKKIRNMTIIILLIVFFSAYIVIDQPISDRLEENVINEVHLVSRNKYQNLKENLLRIENMAESLSSRTEIKKVLSEYINGERSLEELIDFTRPRYEEGLTIYEDQNAVARFTIDGHLLYKVGQYEDIEQYIQWESKEKITKYIAQEDIAMVQSPIKDNEGKIIGFDIILTDISSTIAQIEEGGFNISFLGQLRGDELVTDDEKITSYIDSTLLGETVAISINKSTAFKSIEKLKVYVFLRYILVLLALFIMIQILGIRQIKKYFNVQHALKQKAEESKRKLQIILDVAGEGIMDWKFEEEYASHNKKWSEIMGSDEAKEFHKIDEFIEQIHPEDRERAKGELAKAIAGGEHFYSEHRLIRNDGKTIWVRDRGAIIRDDKGNPLGMIGSMEDISKKKLANKALFLEKEVLKSTLLSVGDGVISTDIDGVINIFNPMASKLTGWLEEEALGQTLNQVFKIQNEENGNFKSNQEILAIGQESKWDDYNVAQLKSRLGQEYSVIYSVAPIRTSSSKLMGFVIVFRNISEAVERQKEIEYLSFRDELTGLYNRRYMDDAKLRLDTSRNLPLVMMVMDIDNLKLTNDIFGHEMGDKLILKTAEVFKEVFRSDDIVARVGGDEFNIILPKTTEEDAEVIRQRIQKKAETCKVGCISISLSIGYAVKTKEEEKIDCTMTIADSNMYEDKNNKRDRVAKNLVADLLEENRKKIASEEEHNRGVSILSALLYKELGKTNKEVEEFRRAVELHDIGKVSISEDILNKEETLTDQEYRLIKRHSQASYEIIRILDPSNTFSKAILYHHERIDGTGYPKGLMGDEIPLESKIISIADAYESMVSKRHYKKSKTEKEAVLELRKNAGTQFDPELLEIFIEKVLPQINKAKAMIS